MQREIAEELDLVVAASTIRPLGRHVATAANEPDHLVEADLFLVGLEGEPRASAEIDELMWIDPARPSDVALAPLTRHSAESAA